MISPSVATLTGRHRVATERKCETKLVAICHRGTGMEALMSTADRKSEKPSTISAYDFTVVNTDVMIDYCGLIMLIMLIYLILVKFPRDKRGLRLINLFLQFQH